MLDDASENCKKRNATFITPPSIEDMYYFMQKENKWRASFLTPIKRYNLTHYSAGSTYRKFSDLSSDSLLKINKTCVKSVKGRLNTILAAPNHKSFFSEIQLNQRQN